MSHYLITNDGVLILDYLSDDVLIIDDSAFRSICRSESDRKDFLSGLNLGSVIISHCNKIEDNEAEFSVGKDPVIV